MPLPEPGTPPDEIYKAFSSLRARVVNAEESRIGTTLDPDFRAKLLIDSPAMLTRFVYWRACTASRYNDSDKDQWWPITLDLFDACLSNQDPSSISGGFYRINITYIRDKCRNK